MNWIKLWFEAHKKRLATLSILALIFIGDEMAGKVALSYYCHKDAGVTVYKNITIKKENWNKDGEPLFIDSFGRLKKESPLSKSFSMDSELIKVSSFPEIHSATSYMKSNDGEILAQSKTYGFRRGWLLNITPFHVSSQTCNREWQKNPKPFIGHKKNIAPLPVIVFKKENE